MPSNGVLAWLMEEEQPSVRYQVLTEILDRPASDSEVREAYGMIAKRGWAADILAEQLPGGYWHTTENLHRPKYVATTWRLLVLADLGLTAADSRVKSSCELFLPHYAKEDGGFGRRESHFCITGNLAGTLIHCRYAEDPRLRRALDWLVAAQKQDGGWHCFPSARGTLDCWEGLSAFAALPRSKWTRSFKRTVEGGAEFYLERRLYREGRGRYEPWFRFHYPSHYYYDLLVGLDVLTALGYSDDPRLQFALKVLREKQRPDGTWLLDAVHPDIAPEDPYKMTPPYEPQPPIPFALEKVGKPSKLITLRALRVLKRVDGALPTSSGP